jgi:hypothetical protein
MATFAPQYNPHKVTASVRSVNNWIFWIVFVLAFVPVFFHDLCATETIKSLLDVINIISILLFFVLEIIVEFILFPQAEQKRRDDFLDNSFGSKFSTANSIDYYSNENINQGLLRAACNLFENSFFTYSLVKVLTLHKIIFPAIVLVSVWVIAYFGFNKVPVALSVLQFLFSANILGNLIKHLILLNKVSLIHDSWITTFQIHDFQTDTLKYQSNIYRNWLNYEAILSRIQHDIPDAFFKKHNDRLTIEWKQIKIRYSINK